MSKDLTFRVELSFDKKIVSDEEIMEIAENVARAIKDRAESDERIRPNYSDVVLEIVRVTPQYLNTTVIEHVD
jgi:energy-converting hydrogenase Eha subunit G